MCHSIQIFVSFSVNIVREIESDLEECRFYFDLSKGNILFSQINKSNFILSNKNRIFI